MRTDMLILIGRGQATGCLWSAEVRTFAIALVE